MGYQDATGRSRAEAAQRLVAEMAEIVLYPHGEGEALPPPAADEHCYEHQSDGGNGTVAHEGEQQDRADPRRRERTW